jgi:hypothetical protein
LVSAGQHVARVRCRAAAGTDFLGQDLSTLTGETHFEELLSGNMSLGRPENVQVIFGSRASRAAGWEFSTRLLNRADQVTINLGFKQADGDRGCTP